MAGFAKESIFNEKKDESAHRREIDFDLQRLFDVSQDIVTLKRTASAGDVTMRTGDLILGITDTSVARTVTLPPAGKVNAGRIYYIKDESGAAGTNNITIDGDGSENIDGVTTLVISTNYGSASIYSDGTQWFSL